jgi:hypothetical protein
MVRGSANVPSNSGQPAALCANRKTARALAGDGIGDGRLALAAAGKSSHHKDRLHAARAGGAGRRGVRAGGRRHGARMAESRGRGDFVANPGGVALLPSWGSRWDRLSTALGEHTHGEQYRIGAEILRRELPPTPAEFRAHVDPDALEEHRLWPRIKTALLARRYPNQPDVLAAEAGAQIAAGIWTPGIDARGGDRILRVLPWRGQKTGSKPVSFPVTVDSSGPEEGPQR